MMDDNDSIRITRVALLDRVGSSVESKVMLCKNDVPRVLLRGGRNRTTTDNSSGNATGSYRSSRSHDSPTLMCRFQAGFLVRHSGNETKSQVESFREGPNPNQTKNQIELDRQLESDEWRAFWVSSTEHSKDFLS
jgi:hypothetical protein